MEMEEQNSAPKKTEYQQAKTIEWFSWWKVADEVGTVKPFVLIVKRLNIVFNDLDLKIDPKRFE